MTEGLKEMEIKEIEFQKKKIDGLMGVESSNERKKVKEEGSKITISL